MLVENENLKKNMIEMIVTSLAEQEKVGQL